jgi:hypothetical protein
MTRPRKVGGVWLSPDQTEMFPETLVEVDEPEPPRRARARARAADPSTSHEAALSVDVTRHRVIVLGAFAVWGRMADETLIVALTKRRSGHDITPQSARSRRAELVRDGFLTIVGEAVTEHGRRCLVFDLTDAGKAEAERFGWVVR